MHIENEEQLGQALKELWELWDKHTEPEHRERFEILADHICRYEEGLMNEG